MPRWTTRTSALSSRTSRYLPLRSAPVILRPTSLEAKCFLLGCRRIERMPATSTALMRRPTASFSRSRRMVSTSGSSGTAAPAGRLRTFGLPIRTGRQHSREFVPRHSGGLLVGLLLAPTLALSALDPAQGHDGEKALGVIRTLVGDLVARQLIEPSRGQLLQPRLEVLPAR